MAIIFWRIGKKYLPRSSRVATTEDCWELLSEEENFVGHIFSASAINSLLVLGELDMCVVWSGEEENWPFGNRGDQRVFVFTSAREIHERGDHILLNGGWAADDGGIARSKRAIEKQSCFQERLITEFVSARVSSQRRDPREMDGENLQRWLCQDSRNSRDGAIQILIHLNLNSQRDRC
jgi:hypothetical protein